MLIPTAVSSENSTRLPGKIRRYGQKKYSVSVLRRIYIKKKRVRSLQSGSSHTLTHIHHLPLLHSCLVGKPPAASRFQRQSLRWFRGNRCTCLSFDIISYSETHHYTRTASEHKADSPPHQHTHIRTQRHAASFLSCLLQLGKFFLCPHNTAVCESLHVPCLLFKKGT